MTDITQPAAKKQILLVEDEQFLSTLLKNRLENDGFEVILARDGEEALNYLKTVKPALVLLDLILPKISGFDVLEAINSDPQLHKAPVMIISNLGQESDIARGKELGAIDYFIKAKISIDDLIKEVEKKTESRG